MSIHVDAKLIEIPLTIDSLHHDTLHSEIAGQVGERFQGLTTREDGTVAHYQTFVSDEEGKAVAAALEGFEARLGPDHSRQVILDDMRTRFDGPIMDLVEGGKASTALRIYEALEMGRELPPEYTEGLPANGGPALRQSVAEFQQRLNSWDIRLILRDELRQKFGDKILDLAIFAQNGKARAFVAWKGDVDEDHIKTIHAVTAKHDPAKAPKVAPVLSLEERIVALEAEIHKKK